MRNCKGPDGMGRVVSNGYNKIVGASSAKMIEAVNYFEAKTFQKETELYGGGNAASFMAEYLKELQE